MISLEVARALEARESVSDGGTNYNFDAIEHSGSMVVFECMCAEDGSGSEYRGFWRLDMVHGDHLIGNQVPTFPVPFRFAREAEGGEER